MYQLHKSLASFSALRCSRLASPLAWCHVRSYASGPKISDCYKQYKDFDTKLSEMEISTASRAQLDAWLQQEKIPAFTHAHFVALLKKQQEAKSKILALF